MRACPITNDHINQLVDGELSGREQRRVAAHVAHCAECSSVAGRILATKAYVGARSPEVEPPAGSWQRLVATLDEADGVAQATASKPRVRRFGAVPALAASGLLLIMAAGAWRSHCVGQQAGMTQMLVRHHMAAELRFSNATGTRAQVYGVVTPRPFNNEWAPVARWLIPHAGQFVDHTLYRLDDRGRVSEFLIPADTFGTTGLRPVAYGGTRYWVRAERSGSIVSWEHAGIYHVLVARTNAAELMSLAASHRTASRRMPSL